MDHAIVFIHLGPTIPPYIRDAIAQARLFNGCPIYLLTEKAALDQFALADDLQITSVSCESLELSAAHRQFREISTLDKTFRGGFWTFTTERFFYLETLMRQLRLAHVFHMENDNLLYIELATLLPVFDVHYPNLAGTFDNDDRCVPGFVYAFSPDSLGNLTGFLNRVLAVTKQPINDMILLGAFGKQLGPNYMGALPIVTPDYPKPLRSPAGHLPADPRRYSNLIDQFKVIFDACAIGQYLGGIDPANSVGKDTAGFINESCVFDPSLYKYSWESDACDRRVPRLHSQAGKSWPIANLHIHSKNLARFHSRP